MLKLYYSWVIGWSKTLAKFFSFQIFLQLLTALTGILIIRSLTKQEYALYTISFAMQSSMTTLSEIGIASVVTSAAGKVWNDPSKFGSLFNTALRLRRYLMLAAGVFIVPLLFYLLLDQGATVVYSFAISLVIILDLQYKISANYKTIVPRFHSQVVSILKTESKTQSLRFVLVVTSLIIYCNTFILNIISLITSFLHNKIISKYSDSKLDQNAPVDFRYQKQMMSIVKSQILYTIFFVTQGQMTIFIISYFGTTENISDVGALSRLALIFNIFIAGVTNYLVPKFSKEESIERLRNMFFFSVTAFILFSFLFVAGSVLFPRYFLLILGDKYQGLSYELPLMVTLSVVNGFIGLVYSLNYSKSWIKSNWIIIPSTILLQVIFVSYLNLSNVNNVLFLGIVSLLPTVLVNVYMSLVGLRYFNQ